LDDLPPPLGWKNKEIDETLKAFFISTLGLPTYRRTNKLSQSLLVNFSDVLNSLAKNLFYLENHNLLHHKQVQEKWQ
jgi:hypothetical protein